jgi:excisionase family DNA binding protein
MSNEHRANLLTVDEAADRLRQSAQSVRRRIQSGELPAFRIGAAGPLRVPAEAVGRLLQPTSPTREPA